MYDRDHNAPSFKIRKLLKTNTKLCEIARRKKVNYEIAERPRVSMNDVLTVKKLYCKS